LNALQFAAMLSLNSAGVKLAVPQDLGFESDLRNLCSFEAASAERLGGRFVGRLCSRVSEGCL